MSGITASGFDRKTFNQLLVEAQDRAISLFGPDINLTPEAFFGLLIENYIFFTDILWQLSEDVYNSGYIDGAEGAQLDAVVKYLNISRNQGVKATGTETFNGTNGTIIPSGTLVASGDIRFITQGSATVVAGTIDVAIVAELVGTQGNLPSGSITTLVNPIAGITSITNATDTVDGQDEETDPDLRERYKSAQASAGKGTLDAIRADILQVAGVSTAFIIENPTDAVVGGLPPHSFEAIVEGGDDDAVGQAILESKAAGIDTFGSTTVNVDDLSGTTRTINYSRPTNIDMWVNVTVTTDVNYPGDGNDQVNAALVSFINSLDIGDDVIISQLSSECFNIAGVIDVTVLEVSDDGITYNATNYVIAAAEKAVTETAKVVVTSV